MKSPLSERPIFHQHSNEEKLTQVILDCAL
jgi:hypothetical protein